MKRRHILDAGLRLGRLAAACVALSSILSCTTIDYSFHVYGFGSDETSPEALQAMSVVPGSETVFFELSSKPTGQRYSRIYNFITARCDIPLLLSSVERRTAPPLVHMHNRDKYYKDFLQPLTGVFHRRRLVAVVVGSRWYGEGFWDRLAAEAPAWEHLHVFALSGRHEVTDKALAKELEDLFLN